MSKEPSTLLVIILAPVILFCLVSLFRGACANICDMFHLYERRHIRKRNRGPDSIVDMGIRQIINQLAEDSNNWETTVDPQAYNCEGECIVRKDGKVKISDYRNQTWLTIEMLDIGHYNADDIKPELRIQLIETCQSFKHLTAVRRIEGVT